MLISRPALIEFYQRVRKASEAICAPLYPDDYQTQSIAETSPPKWHLAHVTWFFETFLLKNFLPDYQAVNESYNYLFNSYYQTIGSMHARAERGVLSRPTVEQVYNYRAEIDKRMLDLLANSAENQWPEVASRVILGLNHEQQHQELLFMDIKHNLWSNPLRPAYLQRPEQSIYVFSTLNWEDRQEGLVSIGSDADSFAFDNERSRHKVWLDAHRLSSRLITNAEYQNFIDDNAYQRPELWLADGWHHIQKNQWQSPLYWQKQENQWYEFTLYGLEALNPTAPVAHISYYEADAFAHWAGKRLPSEAELEGKLLETPLQGHFSDNSVFHPQAGVGQYYGSLWEWTASPYTAYPRFKALPGSMGEYNGKFMCNQWVLRGGSCVTPLDHIRPTYRNFFYPHDRWQFAGIRLAEDL
ncbi:ergothioneine biosynthesis protein EgtB [Crenothrix sp.]|uniref:ergothioneine biosynthesis protein EgtB n=1 Tax=Crenothrix sp. TaxID=3100433 RepID=UPI00374D9F75